MASLEKSIFKFTLLFILVIGLHKNVFGNNPFEIQLNYACKGEFNKLENFFEKQDMHSFDKEKMIWFYLLKAEYYYQIIIIEQFKTYTDSAKYLLENVNNDELKVEVDFNLARYYHYHAKPEIALPLINKAISIINRENTAIHKDFNVFKFYITKASILRNRNRIEAKKYFDIALLNINRNKDYYLNKYEYHKSIGNFYLDNVSNLEVDCIDAAVKHFKLAKEYNKKNGNNPFYEATIDYLLALTFLNSNQVASSIQYFEEALNTLLNIKGNEIWKMARLINVISYRSKAIEIFYPINLVLKLKNSDNLLIQKLMPIWKQWYALNKTKEMGHIREIYANSPYNILISNNIYEFQNGGERLSLLDSILSLVSYVKSFNSVSIDDSIQILCVEKIERKLRNNEILLDFFDNHFGEIFAFFKSKERFGLIKLNRGNNDYINKFEELLEKPGDIQSFKVQSYNIYNLYWKEIEKYIPKNVNTIHLIPHKVISVLNFEVLISDTISNLYKEQKYLFKKYKFNYHYNLSSFLKNEHKSKSERVYSLSTKYANSNYADLPFLKNLASNSKYFSTKFLDDPNLDLEHIYESSNTIHLTAHYIQDDKKMESDSYILVSPELNHKFKLSNLYKLKTNSDLIVFAMCNANRGYKLSSHQIFSLPYFAIHNGANSCVFTLGNLDDYAGAKILSRFYSNLSLGDNKLDALYKAKLDYFMDDKPDNEYHPYYWSTLQFLGNKDGNNAIQNADKINVGMIQRILFLNYPLILVLFFMHLFYIGI